MPFRPLAVAALIACSLSGYAHAAAPITIAGPAGSGRFGGQVKVLPNRNIVVVDSQFDSPVGVADVGAVYLYRPDGTLISTLTGSRREDFVGIGGLVVLSNGNYLVRSQSWDDGVVSNAGAVTFCHRETGCSGLVSAANSLVGSSESDTVGSAVVALGDGDYVVHSRLWNNGPLKHAGAATFGNGETGVVGVVSAANSLVGTAPESFVGDRVVELANGNYVVQSPFWDDGAVLDVGAITVCDGRAGKAGPVTPANSLVGSTAGDFVGADRFAGGSISATTIVPLTNGNFVVTSPLWDNGAIVDAGAATFGRGTGATAGRVGAANSLVGSTANDQVGNAPALALSTGNYVVRSPEWNHGGVRYAGAVTFGSGETGVTGTISLANSLIGPAAGDQIGSNGLSQLANGNYLVSSQFFDYRGADGAGAVTWGDGRTGTVGYVGAHNSLVGSSNYDAITFAKELPNGNYVVHSPSWDNGPVSDAGAATFCDGEHGTFGEISLWNSLVGMSPGDRVGSSVTVLANGNYLVQSPDWDDGAIPDVGAVTFGSGGGGISGFISASISLIGAHAHDSVGASGIGLLPNGGYVVRSPSWGEGAQAEVGAVTWGDGNEYGVYGVVGEDNSLIGTTPDDRVGQGEILPLAGGDFLLGSPEWDRGNLQNAGAVTRLSGLGPLHGRVTAANSLVGSSANDRLGLITLPRRRLQSVGENHFAILVPEFDSVSSNGRVIDSGVVIVDRALGEITADNAAFGIAAGGGPQMTYASHDLIVAVGRPADNAVSVFDLAAPPRPDAMFRDGFEDGAVTAAGEPAAGRARP